MLRKKLNSIIINYIIANLKTIDVNSGIIRYNYMCHKNSVHDAINDGDKETAIVFHLNKNRTNPIIHFINVGKKGMAGGVIHKLSNLNNALLTGEECNLIEQIKHNFTLLSRDINFDAGTAKLGFKVWRYDFLIIENGVPYDRMGQPSSELKFWKKQKGIKVEIINKYLL